MKWIPLIVFSFCVSKVTFSQTKEYHIKDYGAIGNDKKDDRSAIQSCLKDAYDNNGVMVIDYGKYKITKSIYIYIKDASKNVVIRGLPNSNGQLPVISTDSLQSIIVFESDPNNPQGQVEVKNLELIGNNVPYSSTHPYFGKHDLYASGVAAFNVKEVIFQNLIVRNVYGEGLNVRNWNYSKNRAQNRTTKVNISDNKILNCWGANPPLPGKKGPFDEYGDGIYLGNVINFEVKNNIINNDLNITKQFGRSGIVIEDLCANGIVDHNTVNGYDRGMHLEGDLGGYTISRNKFTGSDFGICIYSTLNSPENKPITIAGNYFSNENIPFGNSLKKVRAASERAFISFYTKNDSRKGSVITQNKFYMARNSGLIGTAFMKVYQGGLVLNKNTFNNATTSPVEIYYDQQPSKISNEQYNNVNILFKNRSFNFSKSNNKLINSKSSIKL